MGNFVQSCVTKTIQIIIWLLTGLTDVFCSILMGLIFIGGLGLPTKDGKAPTKWAVVVGCKNGTSEESDGLKKEVVSEGAPGREAGGVVESKADGIELTFSSKGAMLSSSSLNHFSSSSSHMAWGSGLYRSTPCIIPCCLCNWNIFRLLRVFN